MNSALNVYNLRREKPRRTGRFGRVVGAFFTGLVKEFTGGQIVTEVREALADTGEGTGAAQTAIPPWKARSLAELVLAYRRLPNERYGGKVLAAYLRGQAMRDRVRQIARRAPPALAVRHLSHQPSQQFAVAMPR
jgi:hypothetical protein